MSGNLWDLRPLAPGQSVKGTQWWLKVAHFCRQFSTLHGIMQGQHLTPEGTVLTDSLNKGDRNRMDLLTKIEWIFPVCLPVLKLLKLSFKKPENFTWKEMFYSSNEFGKCSWSSFHYIQDYPLITSYFWHHIIDYLQVHITMFVPWVFVVALLNFMNVINTIPFTIRWPRKRWIQSSVFYYYWKECFWNL